MCSLQSKCCFQFEMLIQIVLTCLIFAGASAVDYCSLCSNHIACNNTGNWNASCPADAQLVVLSTNDIQLFLTEHNTLRNKIASGGQAGFLTASRMTTMVWSTELAQLAALNVKQCQMKHDACHATVDFPYSGQNLYASSGTGTSPPINTTISNTVQSWYGEVQYAVQADLNKCCSSTSGKVIGHFTAVVTDRSIAIGCAIATYTNNGLKNVLVACNYAYNNMVGAKVYQTGNMAANCTTGVNPTFKALCSVNEPVKAI